MRMAHADILAVVKARGQVRIQGQNLAQEHPVYTTSERGQVRHKHCKGFTHRMDMLCSRDLTPALEGGSKLS